MMLEITPDDIAALADDDLRTLVGRLCEAELRKRGLSVSAVTWGGHQDAADGGIDVRVDLPSNATIDGFIPRPATGYQVKKPDMSASAITNEMKPGGVLRPSIQALAALKGGYVIVSSTGSVADAPLKDRRQAMEDAASGSPDGADLALDFYDRTRVASWVRDHPGLIPWVRQKAGRQIAGWQSFGPWANPSEAPDAEFLFDETARIYNGGLDEEAGKTIAAGIASIRKTLAASGNAVRLVGLSGVGKTRLVQALFDPRVGTDGLDPALALYTNTSDAPDPVPVSMVSELVTAKTRAIVVVDNCPSGLHRRLTEVCKGSSVSVITVEYDIREDQPEGTEVFSLEPSSVELTEKVLRGRFQELSAVDAGRIAEFSGGNFRVALALANTIGRSESISGLSDAQLFERLFHQRQEADPALMQAAEACSLLYSFDGETVTRDGELTRLGSLIGQSAIQVYGRVAELRRRDLVQARAHWRAVLPHAIANRLARLALQNIPASVLEVQLVLDAPDRVKRSFSRRLGYLHDNGEARRIVEKWLKPQGVLSSPAELDDLHMEMLKNVAPVAPEVVLIALEREAGNPIKKMALLGKRDRFAGLIRSLAYDPELFDRCAALLIDFAVEDNNVDRSEASGALKSLFFPYLSGTHATIEQRIGVMEELIRSPCAMKQKLGQEALRALLEARHFSSTHDFEFGSRSRDFGYHPNFNELQAWYGKVLASVERLVSSGFPGAVDIPRILAQVFRGLWTAAAMYSDLERVSRRFSSKGYWREGWITIRQTLVYDKIDLHDDANARLTELEKELRPSNLVERVQTFVLSSASAGIEIDDLEEDDDDSGRPYERAELLAKELGEEVINDEDVLGGLLPELVTRSGRLFSLGRGLGAGTKEPERHWRVLKDGLEQLPIDRRNVSVLKGFLHELYTHSPDIAASLLDSAVADPILGAEFPQLQCAVPIGEHGVRRLSESLLLGYAPVEYYRVLAWGRAHESVDAADLAKLLKDIGIKPGGVEPALEVLFFRLHSDKDAKRAHEPEIIEAGRALIINVDFTQTMARDDHRLRLIVSSCLSGIEGAPAALEVCKRFRVSAIKSPTSMQNCDDFFEALCKAQPSIVLDTFFTGPESEQRLIARMIQWIGGRRRNPLDSLPEEAVIDWCDRDPATRYLKIAQFISFTRGAEEEDVTSHWSTIALKFIEKAPDPVGVARVFISRFRPSGWSGSLASILEGRKALLEELNANTNPEVAALAVAAAERLAVEVDRTRQWEADNDRERDERFE